MNRSEENTRIDSMEKVVDLKIQDVEKQLLSIKEEIVLRSRMGEVAILKSETTVTERLESHNNKFELLKEQAAHFATKEEVQVLYRFMYLAIGGLLVIEFIGLVGLIKYFSK